MELINHLFTVLAFSNLLPKSNNKSFFSFESVISLSKTNKFFHELLNNFYKKLLITECIEIKIQKECTNWIQKYYYNISDLPAEILQLINFELSSEEDIIYLPILSDELVFHLDSRGPNAICPRFLCVDSVYYFKKSDGSLHIAKDNTTSESIIEKGYKRFSSSLMSQVLEKLFQLNIIKEIDHYMKKNGVSFDNNGIWHKYTSPFPKPNHFTEERSSFLINLMNKCIIIESHPKPHNMYLTKESLNFLFPTIFEILKLERNSTNHQYLFERISFYEGLHVELNIPFHKKQ